jgi:GMP reductase
MRIEDDVKLDFKDVLIRPKRSTLGSRRDVDLYRSYTFKHSLGSYSGIPIMASNMDGVGTFDMINALSEHDLFTCVVKHATLKDWGNWWLSNKAKTVTSDHFAVSIGIGDDELTNLTTTLTGIDSIKFICIDVANGYSEYFGDFVSRVRERFPNKTIIAGNVVTADMTQELVLRGADIIKVGIGPGSVCTTRVQTGVGYPQLSAIIECADAAHGLGAHIIADGGCACPGDVAKAFGAGADFVMLGGMLAGHDEGGGNIVTEHHQTSVMSKVDTKQFVEFYGMSSDTAMNKHSGGVAEYRSSEGRTVRVPYRGPIRPTVLDILGGLRSTCTYVGAPSLKQLSKCTTFVKVNRQINDVFVR